MDELTVGRGLRRQSSHQTERRIEKGCYVAPRQIGER